MICATISKLCVDVRDVHLSLMTLISGGGPGDQEASLSSIHTSVDITVLTNDDPYGVFLFSPNSRELTVAEDYLPSQENTTQATFTVIRNQGLSGDVQVSHTLLCVCR